MYRMTTTVLLAAALAAAQLAPAMAQGLPGATVRADGKAGTTSGRPADRDAMKGQFQERCKDNPQQCEEMKAKMKERHERCKADPEKCRAERKARREEYCKANPQRCAEMKARFEKRREECAANPVKCSAGKDRKPGSK